MRIIIATDSYKGCMRSNEVCLKLAEGILDQLPEAQVRTIPMADGGEGTVDALVAATGGRLIKTRAHDPLGREIEAEYGLLGNGKTAVLEMAAAGGLELLRPGELNPWQTSTYGVGEIIRSIVERGIRDIIIGIGGSATNDGGAGMAQALGYRLLDPEGNVIQKFCAGEALSQVAQIDSSNVIPELTAARIRVACDVTNPLLGTNGATQVYAPQKGADSDMVKALESGLDVYAETVIACGFTADYSHPGDGAAGGLGFGLRALTGAVMESGAELIANAAGIDQALSDADLLITGEGCSDSQTASGKLCAVLGERARRANVPAILVSGALKGDIEPLRKLFCAMFSITAAPCDLTEAFAQTPANLLRMGRNIAGLLSVKS